MWPFREAEELTEWGLISRRGMTLDFGRGDRPSMRIGTSQVLGEYVSAADVPDQRELSGASERRSRGLIRVDRPRAVATQRRVTNSVQSGTIKHGVEGDEGGW